MHEGVATVWSILECSRWVVTLLFHPSNMHSWDQVRGDGLQPVPHPPRALPAQEPETRFIRGSRLSGAFSNVLEGF